MISGTPGKMRYIDDISKIMWKEGTFVIAYKGYLSLTIFKSLVVWTTCLCGFTFDDGE